MIFIAGYHASGKSYMANVLQDDFNCLHIETSAVVRNLWGMMAPEQELNEWAKGMESTYGGDFFDEIIAQNIRTQYKDAVGSGRSNIQDVVVTGNRSLEGVQYLSERFATGVINDRSNHVLAVRVGFDMLLQRYRDRDRRPGDATITDEAFRSLTEVERRRGVEDIFDHADHVIINDQDRDTFREESIEFFENELGLVRDYGITDEWQLEQALREGTTRQLR